jgi:hypothetical protein
VTYPVWYLVLCYSLYLKFAPKSPGVKGLVPGLQWYLEVVEPLRGGVYWEEVRSLGGHGPEQDIGTPAPSSLSFQAVTEWAICPLYMHPPPITYSLTTDQKRNGTTNHGLNCPKLYSKISLSLFTWLSQVFGHSDAKLIHTYCKRKVLRWTNCFLEACLLTLTFINQRLSKGFRSLPGKDPA